MHAAARSERSVIARRQRRTYRGTGLLHCIVDLRNCMVRTAAPPGPRERLFITHMISFTSCRQPLQLTPILAPEFAFKTGILRLVLRFLSLDILRC